MGRGQGVESGVEMTREGWGERWLVVQERDREGEIPEDSSQA